MARIIWAPHAMDDLRALIEYISRDAPMAARRFGQKLVARVDLLANHPLLGGWVSEDPRHRYRELRVGRYRVIYRVEGGMVFVVAIHHGARLLDVESLE